VSSSCNSGIYTLEKGYEAEKSPKADPEKAGAHSVIPVLHQKRNGSEEPPRASLFP
jgi:hypothetical protein